MRWSSKKGDVERLVRRFADACSRRDALLDECRRAMSQLLDAAHHLGGVESSASCSVEPDGGSRGDAELAVPSYPSPLEIGARLRELAAVSAEIRDLRPLLREQPSRGPANG